MEIKKISEKTTAEYEINGENFIIAEVLSEESRRQLLVNKFAMPVYGKWVWEHCRGNIAVDTGKYFDSPTEALQDAMRYVKHLHEIESQAYLADNQHIRECL